MVAIGRGGFGNRTAQSPQLAAKDAPDSPEIAATLRAPCSPAPIQHFTSPQQTVRAGRGGYGNRLAVSKMNVMTPAEYLAEAQLATVEPKRYAIGRGGSGNIVLNGKK